MRKGACALGILLALAACTNGPRPKREPELRSPALLDLVLSLKGEERFVQSRNFLGRLSAERGPTDKEPPPELRELVPRVLTALRRNPDNSRFRAVMIACLGVIGTPRARGHLLRRSQSSTDELELIQIARSLGRIATDDAKRALERMASNPFFDRVRAEATRALARTGDASFRRVLIRQLEDRSAPVRWSAAYGLARHFKDPRGRRILHKMLYRPHVLRNLPGNPPDPDAFADQVILSAAQALVWILDESASEALRKAILSDPNPEVRQACREALAIILRPPKRERIPAKEEKGEEKGERKPKQDGPPR